MISIEASFPLATVQQKTELAVLKDTLQFEKNVFEQLLAQTQQFMLKPAKDPLLGKKINLLA